MSIHRRRGRLLAPLLLAVAACGDPAATTGPDATPGSPDAQLASVTVHVRKLDDLTTPADGVVVFFSNRDGSVAWSGQTDASGTAHAQVEDGGSVTSYWSAPAEPLILSTVVGVHDGDDLDLTLEHRDYGGSAGTVTAAWTPYAGAANANIYDDCDSAALVAGTPSIGVSRCATTQPLDLVAVAVDAAGLPIASAEAVQAFTDGATVTFPAMTPVGKFHVHYDHADIAKPIMTRHAQGWRLQTSANPTAAPTIDLDLPGVHTGWPVQFVDTQAGTPAAMSRIVDPIAADVTSYTLDLAALPTQQLAFTYAGRSLAITTTAPFDADLLYVHFSKMVDSYPLDWYIAAPAATRTLIVPTIPTTPALLVPQDVAATVRPTVALIDSQLWSDFDAHRATVLRDLLGIVNGLATGFGRNREIYAQ
jgi:hypothetical protein